MARKKSTTQFASNQATDITRGLATMESHWRAQDGEIEECSHELWDSWPVQEALKEFPKDPEALLSG